MQNKRQEILLEKETYKLSENCEVAGTVRKGDGKDSDLHFQRINHFFDIWFKNVTFFLPGRHAFSSLWLVTTG